MVSENEVCTRVFFNHTPIVQPLLWYQEKPICHACAHTCIPLHSYTRDALLSPSSKVRAREMVCQCNGSSHTAGCLFQSRFGAGALSEKGLETERRRLEERFLVGLRDATKRMAAVASTLSAEAGASILHMTERTLRRIASSDTKLDKAIRLLEEEPGPPCPERISALAQFLDQQFRVLSYCLLPQVLDDVARNLTGSYLDRAILMAVLVETFVKVPAGVKARAVFSLDFTEFGSGQCSVAASFLQYKLPGEGDWRWGVPALYDGSKTSPQRTPSTTTKSGVLLAITTTGLVEDATENVECNGAAYDAFSMQKSLLDRNLNYLSSHFVTDEDRFTMRSEVAAALRAMRDDVGSALRNRHRTLITVPSDPVQKLVKFNQRLESSTVDNASPVPLRTFPGEVSCVEHFLNKLFALSFANRDTNAFRLDDAGTRACVLLQRCLQNWDSEGKSLVLLTFSDVVESLAKHIGIDGVLTIFDAQHLHVLSGCATIRSGAPEWDGAAMVAILRLVEVLHASAEDHAVLLVRWGPSVAHLLECVGERLAQHSLRSRNDIYHQQQLLNTSSHHPSSASAPHQEELEYQLALTLQAVSTSAAIVSFDATSDELRSSLATLVHAMVSLLVKLFRRCNSTTLFFLVDAADAVFVPPLLELLPNDADSRSTWISLVLDSLKLAYRMYPLEELNTLAERIARECM